MKLPIYLDHHATTPVDPTVFEEMKPFFCEMFGNVSSPHVFGRQVRKYVDKARNEVAQLVGAKADEVIFTSGATESNNLAIKGVAEAAEECGRHIITSQTEHKAVLDTCAYLETRGFEVTYLPVDRDGRISAEQVQKALRHDKGKQRTILVSIMGANNEIGTIHPIADIGKVVANSKAIFHVDGAQFAGKVPVDVRDCQIDVLSYTSHKIYGPKGIGALYLRDGGKDFHCCPQIRGGGQERGMRSGTMPVPLVVGFGAACRIAQENMTNESETQRELRQRLLDAWRNRLQFTVNGHPEHRLSGNLSVTLPGVDAEMLMLKIPEVAFSSGSACSSNSNKGSHVLRALGLDVDNALSTIRIGIGRFNTSSEIDYAADKIASTVLSMVPDQNTGPRSVAHSG